MARLNSRRGIWSLEIVLSFEQVSIATKFLLFSFFACAIF